MFCLWLLCVGESCDLDFGGVMRIIINFRCDYFMSYGLKFKYDAIIFMKFSSGNFGMTSTYVYICDIKIFNISLLIDFLQDSVSSDERTMYASMVVKFV